MSGDFSKVAILGPGLLGGSIALALKERPGQPVCLWTRRAETLSQLHHRGFTTDETTIDLREAAGGADLIILCSPVGAMPGLVAALGNAGAIAPGAIVTDVGSVKARVVRELSPAVADQGGVFIGSHPMAGSEQGGIAHARSNLFRDAACLVTPLPSTPAAPLERLEAFWQGLGMRVSRISPEEHDQALARVSHLPHAVAAALTLAALGPRPQDGALCGNGLRDTTRIAKGGEAMWSEILLENRDALLAPLRNLNGILGDLLVFLENRDQERLAEFLREARELREQLDRPA